MNTDIPKLASDAQRAARTCAVLSTDQKNTLLTDLAGRLFDETASILRANELDCTDAEKNGITPAKLKRLVLTDLAVSQMCDGLRQIATLPDPLDSVTRDEILPTGLRVTKRRAPLGVIAMIYEARPAVTIDAFALCFKAGNACILKGGREAKHSNDRLAAIAHETLRARDLPEAALTLFTSSDREDIRTLLAQNKHIDLVIPRGGEALIRFVHENSTIPTIQHFQGVCHIYVDAQADQAKALEICVTAKTSAPATCNSAECILVDSAIAPEFLPKLAERYNDAGVEMRAGACAQPLMPGAIQATQEDWGHEFLDTIIAVKVVDGLEGAIAHIERYTSSHTEVIVTEDRTAATEFTDRVQSSCVLVNASTRFNDGYQLGLGAEIGISTSRIHAYGPMGLEELTTQRYVVWGDGQTR